MDILQAFFLGLVQGITEFLPVSSSGHLILLQRLGVGKPDNLFNLAAHVGTLAAAIVFYRRQAAEMFRKPLAPRNIYLAAATAVTVVFAVIFKKFFSNILEGQYLAFGFMLTAVVLFSAEYFGKTKVKGAACGVTLKSALICGAAQGFAVMPGLSRSGATISALLLTGADRKDAADFSFLLSMPIILAGAITEGIETKVWAFEFSKLLPVIVGAVTAGIAGFFAVKYFVRLIRNKSMMPFAFYTAALSVLCFIFMGKLF